MLNGDYRDATIVKCTLFIGGVAVKDYQRVFPPQEAYLVIREIEVMNDTLCIDFATMRERLDEMFFVVPERNEIAMLIDYDM